MNVFYCLAGQHWVRAIGNDAFGALCFEGISSFAQSASCIDNIINQQTGAVCDVADNIHDLSLIGLGSAFVDNCKVGVELFRYGAGPYDAADVGRNHEQIFVILSSSNTGEP